jgi:DNA topoisomerase-3
MSLVQFLRSSGVQALTSPAMTGDWESKLRAMEQGKVRRESFMSEIAQQTREMLDIIRVKAGEGASGTSGAAVFAAPAAKVFALKCPKCQGDLLVRRFSLDCGGGCGFRMRREVAGRALSEAEAKALIKDGRIERVEGFVSQKTGKPYAAGLALKEGGEIDLVFASQGPTAAPRALGLACPNCGGALAQKGDAVACDKGDFKLWRVIAGHTLTDAELGRLVGEGSLPPIDGLKSAKGSRFSAGLRLSRDGRTEFVFERG